MEQNTFMPEGALEIPKSLAILICNEIIEDKNTSSKTLVSLFNTITNATVPHVQPRMFIMVSLTNGRGKWPMTFRITSPSGQHIIDLTGDQEFNDPLVVIDMVFDLRMIVLPEAGLYHVDLLAGMTPVAQRRFTVELRKTAA